MQRTVIWADRCVNERCLHTNKNLQVRVPGPGIVDSGNDPEYLSIRELAERIPYSKSTIRNLMSKGQLRLGEHYVKPRGRVMFRWAAIRAWLDSTRERAG